jgi:dTDP-4-dehydrorhamnose 3,5-epimerase-like enzyme
MAYKITLQTNIDERGHLTVIDHVLPFPILRVYYIYNSSNMPRGGHRHHKTIQGLVCVHGSCRVDWTNGQESESVLLDNPREILIVFPEDWHCMKDFFSDAVLLVLASEHYDPDDYIDEGY